MPKQPKKPNWLRNAFIAAVAVAGGAAILNYERQSAEQEHTKQVMPPSASAVSPGTIPYSDFIADVGDKKINTITIRGDRILDGVGPGGFEVFSRAPAGENVFDRATRANPGVLVEDLPPPPPPQVEAPSMFWPLLMTFGPTLLIIAAFIWMARGFANAKGGGVTSFGKSKAKMMDENTTPKTFADVAGCDEAKEEVKELVDFLRDPSQFGKLGGRIPRGVLMVGPPGTGKTLLAKAVAGEAKVPFYSISGSDFVEMFVGVGAARVRDMFEQARKNSPCIIFIDEIDAVGRHRGNGLGNSNDEREQTLNQMLVEMDGFDKDSGVIVIAATNRPDILDPALLRPGRFDRQVHVTLPDIKGREQILNVHIKKVPIDPNVDPGVLARGTPGFSGADLENLVNEAALFAGRRKAAKVAMVDFEKAKDKIMMGPERKSMLIPDEEKRNTAYHEAGHVMGMLYMPGADPLHKVTVIPRGRALGVTMQLPEKDRFSMTRQQAYAMLVGLYGGRQAEIAKFGMDGLTTGASNDLERVTQLATDMVTKYAMTDDMTPRRFALGEGMSYMSRPGAGLQDISEETKRHIETEINGILDKARTRMDEILIEHAEVFERISTALFEYETLDKDDIYALQRGDDITEKKWQERLADLRERTDAANREAAARNRSNDNDKPPAASSKEDDKPFRLGGRGGPQP